METSSATGLVDGPTAFILWRWRYRFTTITVVSGGVLAFLSSSGVPQTWYVNVLGAVMMLGMISVMVLANWCAVRERVEKEAGYTTTRDRRNELMQRDPYLGEVIRPAGAPALERRRFLEIIETAKELASHQGHGRNQDH